MGKFVYVVKDWDDKIVSVCDSNKSAEFYRSQLISEFQINPVKVCFSIEEWKVQRMDKFNQKLDDFMNTQYTIKIGKYQDEDEVGFYGVILEIPEIAVYEEFINDVIPSLEDAKREWGYCAIEDGMTIPKPNILEGLDEIIFI